MTARTNSTGGSGAARRRPELAGLVRRVHGARAGRQRAAAMNDYDVIVCADYWAVLALAVTT
jgi:hypothetical protein